MSEAAAYAGESSALQESDLGLALGERVDALDGRLRHSSGARGRASARGSEPGAHERAWERLLASSPRAARPLAVPLALAVFWLEALG